MSRHYPIVVSEAASAIYWSIWAILMSPTLTTTTIVENISFSTNGHSWQNEYPIESIPPIPTTPSMPQATSMDPPTTLPVPPVAPLTSEDFIIVSGSMFRAMVQLFKTLTAMDNALFWKMANIRAQPSEPRAPAEENIKVDVSPQVTYEAAIKPSSPLKNPAP
ncbi:hypothetical protein CK203_109042 [Vitis vinifera]|uniref:Uncharacterized protein n=1 Tax=Vitis vinifera TaxID=29760 RepID=A0A438C5I0_VITVI|nr:hypothetical protein CK203_109042 [Vitis vinifera]